MQIVLLATGEKENLVPLTERKPSPLLPVVDRPVMAHLLEMLARQEFERILVSLWNQPGAIEEHFRTGRRWGLALDYVLQPDAWGNAGALKWAERLLTGPFIVLPADQLFSLDLAPVVARHQAQGNVATLVGNPAAGGNRFYASAGGRVQEDGNQGRPLAATGIAVLEPDVLGRVPRQQQFDLYSDLVPALLAAGLPVGAYEMSGYWNPLDTFAAYRQAQWDMLRSAELEVEERVAANLPRHPDLLVTQIAEGIWVGHRNGIHPTVRMSPPVYVGNDCALGSNVELGPGAVIGSFSVVADGATVCNSVVLDHTYVGELVHVDGRIVSGRHMVDVETGENIALVDEFLLSEARPEMVGSNAQRWLERLAALVLLGLSWPLLLLVGLLVFLFTGRLLARVPRIVPRRAGGDGVTEEETITLLRFYTRRPNGSFIGAGRWLEEWELHRLPELWNVIRGDLALIGVKPLAPAQREQMEQFWEETRRGQPGGFTGLWYVQTDRQSELDEVLATDAYYAATRTWHEDLRLLYKTLTGWRQRQNGQHTLVQ